MVYRRSWFLVAAYLCVAAALVLIVSTLIWF